MRKPLHKLATILIALTLLVWSNLGWGQASIYSTGFESAESFAAGTVYNNTTVAFFGPEGQKWGTYYGTPSTTGPISGSQSMQMRWYTSAASNLGYTFTDFNLTKVSKVTFLAANTLGLNVTVSYSTNGGSEFVGDQTFILTGTPTLYTYIVSETSEFENVRIRFRIALPDPIPTGTARLYIDDVTVYGSDETAPVPTFSPTSGETDVMVSVNPTITFDELIYTSAGVLVDDTNVESLISFTSAAKADVPFTATIADKVITIVPDAVLANEMEYTVTIQPVQDAAENIMDAAASATFTTIAATAQAIELTGDYAAPYYAGEDVTVTWTSANIDVVKVEAWVPSENEGAGGWITMTSAPGANGTATFTIPADAQYSASYKIRVSDEADGVPNAESGNIKVREVHASLETLRARPANTEARFDGSAIVTYSRPAAGRNQKYIQDDKAAILIDDNSLVITQAYPVGSEISGLVGRVSPFNAFVQFVPLADPGAPISLGNDVVPFDANIADITSADQAKLIKLTNVKFTTFGTGVFVSGSNYDLTDENQATKVFRASFAEADYIGQSIPTATISELLVLVGENNGVIQLTSRSMADWQIISTDATLSAFKLGGQSVLELAGVVVADPAADAGATLNVADFTGFAGVEVTSTDANATFVVKLNGTVVEAANLATQALADGDVVVVTVTAEDGTTVKNYKVTLSSENRVLTLTAPVGGATFNTGDDIVFTWTAANIENVNLYAVDVAKDAEEAHLINDEPISAALGTYTHTIENGVFGSYIIRIADAADVAFFDETATAITITDDDAPNAVEFTPANGATGVALSFTLSAEFDEDIKLGTGNLTIHKASDNSVVVTVPAANITVDYDGATAEITGLDWETAYYVNVEAGLLLDMSDNPVGAITTATDWAFTTRQEPGSDLFFSEYIEGDGNNRAFEIFNPTAETIDLSHYVIKQSYNGAGWGIRDGVEMTEYILPLTGTLESKAVYVIYNADAGTDISNVGDLSLAYGTGCDGCRMVSFTGNDALGLFKDGELIDQIGDPSSNTNFDVAGVTGASVDHTLVRKSSVVKGNINWAVSAGTNTEDSEWIVFDKDTYEHLGSHDFASSVRPVWGTSIAAFPNPFTHTLYIDNAENATRVVVINLIGQQVMSVNLNGDNRVPIATENLAKGIYLISIENNKGERTVRKMIKR